MKLDRDMYETAGALTLFWRQCEERFYPLWEQLIGLLRKDLPKSIKVIRFELNNFFSKGLVQRVLAMPLKKMEICCSCIF